jgi:uncharacterized protein (DUF1800 family)
VRFLLQAALDAAPAEVERVRSLGYAGWLDQELARAPQAPTRYEWMLAQGYAVEENLNSFRGADAAIWRGLIAGSDPLRQRMALALSEILVVSMGGLPMTWRGFAVAHYADLLEAQAFGNFRSLIEAVSLSPAMGVYLNMRGNRRSDANGRLPDENYARELMQLFTIGLYALNADGTQRWVDGKPVETYAQDDISALARVLTGWELDDPQRSEPGHVRRPMLHIAGRFEPGDKTVLGRRIGAERSGPQALGDALDLLFQHPNAGPFLGRQLIQRFTQSNPSPAYVGRVAAAFADNGQGVRGDLKALLRAVLLDAEARPAQGGNGAGKLREPVLRLVQLARSFGAGSASERWAIGDTSDAATRLGQSPLRSPSVFNFFRPGYVPPVGELGARRITAPEFQLCNESAVAGYLNYLQTWIFNGVGDLRLDFGPWLAQADEPARLVERLALRLSAGQVGVQTQARIATALSTMGGGTDAARLERVRTAVLLLMACPEYLVQQ